MGLGSFRKGLRFVLAPLEPRLPLPRLQRRGQRRAEAAVVTALVKHRRWQARLRLLPRPRL